MDRVGAFLAGLTGGAAPIATHISEVFVGPEIAYKRRKKVKLTFLDFTQAADRRRYAERELALNAPYAPGLYRGVHAITEEQDGTLALDGAGEAIDWVVAMAPVPANAFLDAVAAAGRLTPALLDAMADAVATMHTALPPAQGHNLAEVARGNAQAALAAGLPPDRVAAWETACLARIAAQAEWHQGRALNHVRRCHGDLHLGNMVLLQGRPCPFDALEFDEALATIDTGYDLAFLLMDLEQKLGRAAANLVLNRYVARTGDAALVAGLPTWLSLRALIRAHVQERQGTGRGLALLAAAETYPAPPTPMLVAVGGLQGTGKSTLAHALAPELGAAPGALVLRSDAIRKRLAGVAPETRLPAAAYSQESSDAVYAQMLAEARAALAGGHAVVVDAVFQRPAEREAIAALVPLGRFLGVWLEAPLPLLHARLEARRNDASDADAAVLVQAASRDAGAISWARVDASDGAAALARVRRSLQVA